MLMKRPQTKFYGDTMIHSKVFRSKKVKNLSLSQNLSLGQNFLAAEFFSRYRYFIKVTTTDFDKFYKFSCNSEIVKGLLRLLT